MKIFKSPFPRLNIKIFIKILVLGLFFIGLYYFTPHAFAVDVVVWEQPIQEEGYTVNSNWGSYGQWLYGTIPIKTTHKLTRMEIRGKTNAPDCSYFPVYISTYDKGIIYHSVDVVPEVWTDISYDLSADNISMADIAQIQFRPYTCDRDLAGARIETIVNNAPSWKGYAGKNSMSGAEWDAAYMKFYSDDFLDLSFISPEENFAVVGGQEFSIYGTCPNNGAGQLALTTNSDYVLPENRNLANYNIDCVNNTWRASASMSKPDKGLYLIDKQSGDSDYLPLSVAYNVEWEQPIQIPGYVINSNWSGYTQGLYGSVPVKTTNKLTHLEIKGKTDAPGCGYFPIYIYTTKGLVYRSVNVVPQEWTTIVYDLSADDISMADILEIQFKPYTCDRVLAGAQTTTIVANAPSWEGYRSGNGMSGGDHIVYMKFYSNNNNEVELSFTSPESDSSVYENQDFVVSGTCPNNGANQLFLTSNKDYTQPGYPVSLNYNIDCVDNKWNAPTTLFTSNSGVYVIDRQSRDDAFLSLTVQKNPVVIIPGIMGSFQKNSEWIIDPVTHTYDNLIDTFIANGYEENKTLFEFPYDWRQPNETTAIYLENKIQQIKEKCNCNKVDLVAHSMGGIVARQYIQFDRYKNDVDQLVFLATPHLGSPKAYLSWEGGETGPTIISDTLYQWYITRQAKRNGFKTPFEYIRKHPILSVQELLPIFNYLKEDAGGNERVYPYFYPRNQYLEELNKNTDRLYNSGIRIVNYVGELPGNTTITHYKVIDSRFLPLWEDGYPNDFYRLVGFRGMEYGIGDETVPINSASYISNNIKLVNANHGKILTSAEGLVFKELTNSNATFLIDKSRGIDKKFLVIDMLSPADIMVITPDGKRIGKIFETGEEINEIEDAFYSGFETDNEYITIPNPIEGEYKVIAKGTGNGGEYTIASGYVSDSQFVDKDFTASIEPGMVTEIKLVLDSSKPEELLKVFPLDIEAPKIEIVYPESKDYLHSEVLSVNVSVNDESGVKKSEFKLDKTTIVQNQDIDLFYEKLGNHTFTVYAEDNVGNTTTTVVNFRIIATPDSTISDIERAYSLGWIDNFGIKQSLLKKLECPGQKDENGCKISSGAILNELEAQKGKHINEKAYNLLKEDINWLINYK